MPTDWKHAIGLSEIPATGLIECVVDGRILAIFNINGKIHAADGICPHQGGSLGKGSLHGCVVRCPWHGWEYDVTNGQHQSIPAICIPTFETRISADNVEVRFP